MTPECEEPKDCKRRKDRNAHREQAAKAKLNPKLAAARQSRGKQMETNRNLSLQRDTAMADARQSQGKQKETNRNLSLQQDPEKADARKAQGKKKEKNRKSKLDIAALERRLDQLSLADEKRQRLDKDPARIEKRREQKARSKRYVHHSPQGSHKVVLQ